MLQGRNNYTTVSLQKQLDSKSATMYGMVRLVHHALQRTCHGVLRYGCLTSAAAFMLPRMAPAVEADTHVPSQLPAHPVGAAGSPCQSC